MERSAGDRRLFLVVLCYRRDRDPFEMYFTTGSER
jgi:hypothetical protein